MLNFRDIPIRQKLMVIVMATTTVALLLAGGGIVIFDSILFRGYLERDLSALSRIIGDNSTAALSFNDPRAAAETLATLRARPHVVTACVYRPDGTLLAGYARPGATGPCPLPAAADSIRFGANGLTVSHAILLDKRRIGTLMLLYDLDEIGERMRLYGGIVLGFILVSGLVAFLVSAKLRALIATPVAQLVRATTSVSETSDYSIRARKFSGDELGVLVDRFNEMLSSIEMREDTLTRALVDREDALREAETSRERFRFMAESMPQKIFTATPAGDIDYVNLQLTEYTGLSSGRIREWGWPQFVHPDDAEEHAATWKHSLETGEPLHFQHRLRRADGVYRWHLSRAYAMRDDLDNISMWIGSDTDIHEQKLKEEELRRANDDLQQFAYSASHDLQEPVRNVAIYSELVAKRYKDVIDADGQRYLEFLTEGGHRLATLINDLLAYTRAGVVEGEVPLVDSTLVLQHTLEGLSEVIRENKATVTYDALPEVQMGETHLQQVFQNLIVNSIKYRNEKAPRIHISAARRGRGWVISVQDNGIGIDPQYREKIFGVFKRLHRDERYSGTGIGLAICQRVVQRYGGQIWVESTPGEGATFLFTIPAATAGGRTSRAESSGG
ncbi:MAG TPA: ATP-binding protein [Bryobacteraceae bacterium]|jgi:PAS domain S-box-containing protein|nr:ATP-binding protein [Bryobacteraceae bacterium]